MFRYERPQKGRKRQFFQAGVELIGNAIYGDLEVIQVANMILDKLGIESNLEINFLGDNESLKAYNKYLDDYLSRFSKLSKPFGLSLNPVVEIEDKKGGGPMSEAKLLIKSFQKNSKIIALDERGAVLSSPEFTKYLSGWAADGVGYCHLVIGGADGLDKSLLDKANLKILRKKTFDHFYAIYRHWWS